MGTCNKKGLTFILALTVAGASSASSGKQINDVRGTRPIELFAEAGDTSPVKSMPLTEFKSQCLVKPQPVKLEKTDPKRGPYYQISCNNENIWVREFQVQSQAMGAGKIKCVDVVIKDSEKGQPITATGGGRGLGGSVCGDK